MRDYSKITPRFWIGKTGRALRGDSDSIVVAAYLCTGPHANMIGLYYLPIAYISGDTGIPYEGVAKALDKLTSLGFCSYDPDTELVWVISMLKIQVAERLKAGDNNSVAVAKIYEILPESRILSIFYDKYSESHNLPFRRGLDSPLPRAFISQEQEQEQKQETEQEHTAPLALVSDEPKHSAAVTEVFNYWAETLGHKRARLDATRTKLIKAAFKIGYTVEDLKLAIDGNKGSPHHQGQNDRHMVYDSLELILRDAKHIDGFIADASGRGIKSNAHNVSRHEHASINGVILTAEEIEEMTSGPIQF